MFFSQRMNEDKGSEEKNLKKRDLPQGTFPVSFGNSSVTLQLVECSNPESEDNWNVQNAV